MVWFLVFVLVVVNVVAFVPSLRWRRPLSVTPPAPPVQVPSEAPLFRCSGCGVQAELVTWAVVSDGEHAGLQFVTSVTPGSRCPCAPGTTQLLPVNAEARAMPDVLPMLRRDIAFDAAFNPNDSAGASA